MTTIQYKSVINFENLERYFAELADEGSNFSNIDLLTL